MFSDLFPQTDNKSYQHRLCILDLEFMIQNVPQVK